MLAARALNDLVQNVPPATQAEHAAMLERMRVDAERAGFESLAVAAYFQGKARLAIREGDLGRGDRARSSVPASATAASSAAAGGPTTTPSSWPGSTSRTASSTAVDEIIDDIRELPGVTGLVIPGLAFHVACRRGDLAGRRGAARRGLPSRWPSSPGAAARRRTTWCPPRSRSGLPLERIVRMGKELLAADVWDAYRSLVEAQIHEARGDLDAALDGYVAVADAIALPPPVRGTAHVGAARCLLARGRRDEAVAHLDEASDGRWRGGAAGGWPSSSAVRDQLGLAPADGQRERHRHRARSPSASARSRCWSPRA